MGIFRRCFACCSAINPETDPICGGQQTENLTTLPILAYRTIRAYRVVE